MQNRLDNKQQAIIPIAAFAAKGDTEKLAAEIQHGLDTGLTINEIKEVDFVMDALATGRRIKCLTCVDDFTKECLTVTVAFGISGVQVTRILDSIALFRGYRYAPRLQ